MKISFVIPCYRSEDTIRDVLQEIRDVMSIRPEYDYETVCVNDCSPDNVYGVLCDIASNDDKLVVVNFSRNFGKASAVLAGCNQATGDYIVSLDDDGQCPVDKTWDLVDALINDECDIAMADYPVKKESLIKRLGSKVNNSVMKMLIYQPDDVVMNNFLAMKRFVAEEITKYTNPYPCLHPLFLQATHSIKMIPMEERDRFDGKASGFTFIKSFMLMINGFTNFSVKPLRMASVLGAIVALCGFIYGIVTVINKLINPNVYAGYTSIMAVLLFIGGILMILLGIIGEYIGRIYICINNAPQYIVKNVVNKE